MLRIGVDSGGTFTDTVVIADDGRIAVGKALSTPGRPADGVLDSIGAAVASLGLTPEQALADTEVLAHGTTVGLNAVLTGDGARAAMLTTSGFEDTIPIARINKALGLDERDETQAIRWCKPPALVPPQAIRGVVERIDVRGDVLVPLDEEQARAAIRALGERGAQAIGISLLWSFLNPAHERRLAELVREELGEDIEVMLSSELAPRIGEYERGMTVLLNAYVAPAVATYLRDLERRLRERGFRGSLVVMRSGGGVQPAAQLATRPVETLRSGPVGGISAAQAIGRRAGHRNIVTTDVGGTSFDVGLVVDGEPQESQRAMIGRYALASSVIDIESIGTGGGSIAWIDPVAGTLRVGPQSAGAHPGPVCYGRGGDEPTVTDAAVALGYVERLGGSLALDVDAARAAIESRIARPLRLTSEQAAEGILTVANAHMADLIRRVTIQRGYDPRDFVLYAFGGAAPQYAGRYAIELGVDEIVIPIFAPVFSAFGAIASDLRTSAQIAAPRPFPPPVDWLEEQLARLTARVMEQLDGAGDPNAIAVERFVGLRFRNQVHELPMPLPPGPLAEGDLERVLAAFTTEYERQFGAGTAYVVAGVEVVGLTVEGTIPVEVALPDRSDAAVRTPSGVREAWFGGERHRCDVWDGERVAPDVAIVGPAFVEVPTTTTVVYPGQVAHVDPTGSIVLRSERTPAGAGAGAAPAREPVAAHARSGGNR